MNTNRIVALVSIAFLLFTLPAVMQFARGLPSLFAIPACTPTAVPTDTNAPTDTNVPVEKTTEVTTSITATGEMPTVPIDFTPNEGVKKTLLARGSSEEEPSLPNTGRGGEPSSRDICYGSLAAACVVVVISRAVRRRGA